MGITGRTDVDDRQITRLIGPDQHLELLTGPEGTVFGNGPETSVIAYESQLI